jgi:hypothetical protein
VARRYRNNVATAAPQISGGTDDTGAPLGAKRRCAIGGGHELRRRPGRSESGQGWQVQCEISSCPRSGFLREELWLVRLTRL